MKGMEGHGVRDRLLDDASASRKGWRLSRILPSFGRRFPRAIRGRLWSGKAISVKWFKWSPTVRAITLWTDQWRAQNHHHVAAPEDAARDRCDSEPQATTEGAGTNLVDGNHHRGRVGQLGPGAVEPSRAGSWQTPFPAGQFWGLRNLCYCNVRGT